MALERRLGWRPDPAILKELNPRQDEGTRTRLFSLSAAGSLGGDALAGDAPTVPRLD